MTPPKKILFCIPFILSLFSPAFSQSGTGLTHEIGVVVGPVAFQSDYGERRDFDTNKGNTGIAVGLVYFMGFEYLTNYRLNYFEDHFKLKAELSYTKTDLKHFGKYVEESKTSVFAQQLRAMRGSSKTTNAGVELVYFPFSLKDYGYNSMSFAPYASFGAQANHYTTEARTYNGPLTPLNTPEKYRNGYRNTSDYALSIVGSIGTRYKINANSDLIADMRLQYFNSDWIDGLRPDPAIYKENKANDWLAWFTVGYVYYLPE